MHPVSIPVTFDGRRTIPSPEVTKLIIGLLALKPGDKVLEIGTGSGSQTKALAETGAEVHSVELEPWLDAVDLDGKTNIYLHVGDGVEGLKHEAPFSAIVATCGLEQIPHEWVTQLGPAGNLVAPVGDSRSQRLTLFVKQDDELVPVHIAAYCRFQMMREKPKPGKIPYVSAEVSA